MAATPGPLAPGVYVTEVPAFPPGIVGVGTAIPAFIGYTEMAQMGGTGPTLYNQAVEISSMADFQEIFGGPYEPLYNITEVQVTSPTDSYDFDVVDPTGTTHYYTLADASMPAGFSSRGLAKFNLYNSVQFFFDNGGSTAYIVSVGNYSSTVSLTDLQSGLNVIENQVGPTMLVIPEAILLQPSDPSTPTPWVCDNYFTLVQAMIGQASTLLDRVALIDVYGTQFLPPNSSIAPVP